MYLSLQEEWNRQRQPARRREELAGRVAALAGLPALAAGFHPTAIAALELARTEVPQQAPALLLLAVRAARRALAANPDDANAWFCLGQAYLHLRDLTVERSREGRLPLLAQLRQVQTVAALENALALDPDLEPAHHLLAYLYLQRRFLDCALGHCKEEVRLARQAPPRPGERADRLARMEQSTADVEKRVIEGQNAFAFRSRSLRDDPVARAGLALDLGLAGQALDEVLLPTPAVLLGPEGMNLELGLLLLRGRVEEVRTVLAAEDLQANRPKLGYQDFPSPPAGNGPLYPLPYHLLACDWLEAAQAAAAGDYGHATTALAALRAPLDDGLRQVRQHQRLGQVLEAGMTCFVLSPAPGLPQLAGAFLAQHFHREQQPLQSAAAAWRAQEADLWTVEGLLRLEQGDPAAAGRAFEAALALCPPRPTGTADFAGWPMADYYLGRIRAKNAR
jgi:tetratricopeptide (TPR) repeat protein